MKSERVILTRTGKVVDLTSPTPEMIDLTDITYALARIPRFGGHTRSFWSVGQHSLLCYHIASCYVAPKLSLHALLHDAAEAYIGDLSSPLKTLLPQVRLIEQRLLEVIYRHFGQTLPTEEERRTIKDIDTLACIAEARFFLPHEEHPELFPLPSDQHSEYLVNSAHGFIRRNLYVRNRKGNTGYAGYGELSKRLETLILSELHGLKPARDE